MTTVMTKQQIDELVEKGEFATLRKAVLAMRAKHDIHKVNMLCNKIIRASMEKNA